MSRYSETVAKLCQEAQRLNVPATKHVATAFGISDVTARGRIRNARRDGCNVPHDRAPRGPVVKSAPIHTLTLACSCGFTARVDRSVELFRHCLVEHGRRPSLVERTPVTNVAA